jgi:hypothetical protein
MAVMTISGGMAYRIYCTGRLSASLPDSGVGMELNTLLGCPGWNQFSSGGRVLLTLLGAHVTITNGSHGEVSYSYPSCSKAPSSSLRALDKVMH